MRRPAGALPRGDIGIAADLNPAKADRVAGCGLELVQHADAVLRKRGGDFLPGALLLSGGEGERQAQGDKERAVRVDPVLTRVCSRVLYCAPSMTETRLLALPAIRQSRLTSLPVSVPVMRGPENSAAPMYSFGAGAVRGRWPGRRSRSDLL